MFDDLRDLYQDIILDHGRHPRHGARLAAFDATAEGDNPMCGDRVRVWARHDGEGRVAEIGFEARGCAISIASADLMAGAVCGGDDAAARDLARRFAAMVQTGAMPAGDAALAGLAPLAGVHAFPSRIKCATLAWHALVAALDGKGEAGGG